MSHNFLSDYNLNQNLNFQLDSPKQFSFYLVFNNIQTAQQAVRRRAKDVAFMNRAIQRRRLKMGPLV